MQDPRKPLVLSKWFLVGGGLTLPGAAALTLRFVWEETLLTAREGPQMVGFSLMHVHPIATLLLLVSTVGLHLWAIALLLVLLLALLRRRRLSASSVVPWFGALVLILPLYVPDGWWRYLVLRVHGPGDHGWSHLTMAAARGELYNLRELLRQDLPVDATRDSRSTALSAACVEGRLEAAQLLVANGANVNWRGGILGYTPLHAAAEMNQTALVEYLLSVGANASIVDDEGRTALTVAREKGRAEVVSILERNERK